MTVTVNGETTELKEDITIEQVLTHHLEPGSAISGLAVALNGEVVSRTEWSARRLRPHDRIEVLAARGGG